MAKQYYIKKGPSVDGPNVEWIAINGKEFYQLITSPAGKGRYFIDMDDFMIEASKADYTEWRKEKDHHDYLCEQEADIRLLSLYSDMPTETGSGEEIISDKTVSTEELVIKAMTTEKIFEALRSLDTESYRLIDALILSDFRKTERSLAAETGLSKNAIHKQKKKILENLKFLVGKSEKSSQ